ncbi:transporter substrate-binding domain-containing protein [Actinoplanes derwentensis]|uniref:Amino acid ABC transporter substrate-binding protein, PAAT family n=1 Tax=Actinoplanes derwentensis TaxID=113562 RepID=A0A1H2DBW4_9ACTN|nr:transporter substrate-binding domain-containing protein [Actinoplanes derwentensis]GID87499.1 ectoine/hydroxyectoine ABC transporter substrate-binding protein EhuB [Actinoplanes derwentensis]SDT80223.1 amino acid ABC transporter substrate-binding protein, PAAT family [Actinoplanes derwentensis]
MPHEPRPDPAPPTPWTRRRVLGTTALVSATLLSGCPRHDEPVPGDALARLRRTGVARLAVAGEEPFGFVDADGELTGAMPQIARQVLAAIGVARIEPLVISFDSLIDAVLSGSADIVAAGMSITAPRCTRVAFTRPDFLLPQALGVRGGNPLGLTDYDSIAAQPGIRLGVLAGAVETGYATAAGIPAERIIAFTGPDQLTTAVIAGDIDAFALTSLSVRRLVATAAPAALDVTPSFTPVVDGTPRLERGAMAFHPEAGDLIDAYAAAAADLRRSGAITRILRVWGYEDQEIADDTEKGCSP